MLYFAYGSNLDWKQMKKRCPSASFLCKAKLKDYRLEFTRYSKNRKCGVADVVPISGNDVWGFVYKIADDDIGELDKSEGFRPERPLTENSYVRKELHVFKEGDENKPLLVSAYIANAQVGTFLPNADYRNLIVEGAKWWRLPDEYIVELEKIKTE